jgi:hypothetical protein
MGRELKIFGLRFKTKKNLLAILDFPSYGILTFFCQKSMFYDKKWQETPLCSFLSEG